MTESQLLKYCHFYRGETLPPVEYDGNNLGKLWTAEKFVCEELSNSVDDEHSALSMAQLVLAYAGKWAPFKYYDILQTYLERCPDEIKSQLH